MNFARCRPLLPIFVLALVACGDDGGATPAPPTDTGGDFLEPETFRPDDGTEVPDSSKPDTPTDSADAPVDSPADVVDSADSTPADTAPDVADTPPPPTCSSGAKLISVGDGGLTFSPSTLSIKVGEKVCWQWKSSGHSVVSGAPLTCTPDGKFCSPSDTGCGAAAPSSAGAIYEHTFGTAGTFTYFCGPHCSAGMTGTVVVTP